MGRLKEIWSGKLHGSIFANDKRITIPLRLDRDPGRQILLKIYDPQSARSLARSLNHWADRIEGK